MKILIDPGHGRNTPGKRSPDGRFREYQYTREIAAAVVARLQALGHDAQLLVPEQEDISLSERCRRVNAICQALGPRNVILISIHVNAAGRGDRCGTMPPAGAHTLRGATPVPMPWPRACMKPQSSICQTSAFAPTTPTAIRIWRPTSTSSATRSRLQSLWRTSSWILAATMSSFFPQTGSKLSSICTSTASADTCQLLHSKRPHFPPHIPHFPHLKEVRDLLVFKYAEIPISLKIRTLPDLHSGPTGRGSRHLEWHHRQDLHCRPSR